MTISVRLSHPGNKKIHLRCKDDKGPEGEVSQDPKDDDSGKDQPYPDRPFDYLRQPFPPDQKKRIGQKCIAEKWDRDDHQGI